jgi:hypothetical protein
MTIALQQGVTESLTCHRICEETITHCLHTGGAHSDPDQIRLLMDCADICRVSSDFMVRGSAFHAALCALCADICETCAVACERFHDDAQMVSCAQACRRCAQACRQMARAR